MVPFRRGRMAGRCVLAALLLLAAIVADDAPARADENAWRAFAEPGTAALMRHALAPGFGDPPEFTVGDCATQRNLDEAGRRQARAAGGMIRGRGIAIDRVLTSQWYRCRETAALLGLGPVEEFPALNSVFRRPERAEIQTRLLRAFLADAAAGKKLFLVTHQSNIRALTGGVASSGEIVIVSVARDGQVTLKGRIPVPMP